MSGSVFNRLQQKLDVEKREAGISPLELAQLPASLRKIMRLMLREVEIAYPDLCQAVETMPPADRLNRAELDEALETLTRQNWLIRRGEGERMNYTVNLRRKPGSQLAKSFWAALDEKIAQSKGGKASP